ncbi:MAG TPA: AAA family ATPase, partial [Beijerinckiaceae bacterium]|nr:AAA family ATPase [Beijerinckiaceae bacterium]
NEQALRPTSLMSAEELDAFAQEFRRALARHAERLEARRAAGKVKRCHGDLILRNICLLDGVPTPFDCIEFDETLATIDVLYDLAFLLMDLWHREQRRLANLVLNRYLDECDESDGLALVPFFMAARAAVRAHVTASQASETPVQAATPLRSEARAYFDAALAFLRPGKTQLVAIGGLSGTGKSTVAAHLAADIGAPPGARILSSDRLRKRLHGVPAETRLPESAYLPEVSEAVYGTLRQEAARALTAGSSVIVDAVFDRPAERAAIEATAAQAGVAFQGIWLDAPTTTLLARIEARRNDPSDATTDVLHAQLARDCGAITWRRISAELNPATIRETLLTSLPPAA